MATLRDYPDRSIEFGGSMSGSQLMVASGDGDIERFFGFDGGLQNCVVKCDQLR